MVQLPSSMQEGVMFVLAIFGLALTVLIITYISHRRQKSANRRYLMKYLALNNKKKTEVDEAWDKIRKSVERAQRDFS